MNEADKHTVREIAKLEAGGETGQLAIFFVLPLILFTAWMFTKSLQDRRAFEHRMCLMEHRIDHTLRGVCP